MIKADIASFVKKLGVYDRPLNSQQVRDIYKEEKGDSKVVAVINKEDMPDKGYVIVSIKEGGVR